MNKMKNSGWLALLLLAASCKQQPAADVMFEGKVERDQIAVVTKVAGKIHKILVAEGDFVQAGDTLALLDIPEVDAKAEQAQGALQSADAQYNMAVKGATSGQLVQLRAKVAGLKEQYDFAQKSIGRLENLLRDSLIPQQKYDETYAKFQGAKNQYLAAEAELEEASRGARYEQQIMALGQKERAKGAVAEVKVAEREKYVLAPQAMSIETINLKVGELALPGYPIIGGFLAKSTYFRFSIPEDKVAKVQKGTAVELSVPYLDNKVIKGHVVAVKALNAYANIATAYPDFDNQLAVFEVKVQPDNDAEASALLTRTMVKLHIK